MSVLIIDGIEMSVEKKRIKNIYIRILPPGIVKISAPTRTSDETVRAFAVSKITWIHKHLERFRQNPPAIDSLRFAEGDVLYLWGQPLKLHMEYTDRKSGAAVLDSHIVLRVKKDSTAAQCAAVLDALYRRELTKAVPPVLETCERITGVKAAEWRIKKMRTKWGTCNIRQRRVWLNLRLAEKAPECLEYVVIHELTHLYEAKHNQIFSAYMDRFCPDWRGIKALLNSGQRG